MSLNIDKGVYLLMQHHDASGYWRANLRLILICFLAWLLCSYLTTISFSSFIKRIEVGGLQIGLFFTNHGFTIYLILMIIFYAWRLSILDKQYGLEDEPDDAYLGK